jgi:hypothetical protein
MGKRRYTAEEIVTVLRQVVIGTAIQVGRCS